MVANFLLMGDLIMADHMWLRAGWRLILLAPHVLLLLGESHSEGLEMSPTLYIIILIFIFV